MKEQRCLGSAITDEGSKPEILSRIAQTTTALTRLKPVWIDKSISLSEDSIEQGTEVNCTEFPYSTWAQLLPMRVPGLRYSPG